MRMGVIVPVRAPAPWLGEALGSVLAQDPRPDRVVVVDNASPEPLELGPEHAAACELVRREAPGGPDLARQAGLDRLDTDLVALLDADDAWEPGKLRAQADALDRHPEAVLCFGRATIVGPDGAPTGERWAEPAPGFHAAADLAPELFTANPIPTSSVLARAEALRAVGGFTAPPEAVDDWDLWLRLLAAGGGFVCEPSARVRYRRHSEALTADVAWLARAGLAVHERHARMVDAATRDRVRAADLRALARGLAAQGRSEEARAALREAAGLARPAARDRALALVLAVPGLRAAAGRRDAYTPR